MHGVPHCSQIQSHPTSHAAHHRRAGMDTETYPEWLLHLLSQGQTELGYAGHDSNSSGQCLGTAVARGGLHAEQGHDTVARKLVSNPTRLLNSATDDIEVVI